MSNSQKGSRKDFSLNQYYSQLEKYQAGITNSKSRLRKDNSTSSFSKETPQKEPSSYTTYTSNKDSHYRFSNPSALYKTAFHPERQKITITDKPNPKPPLQRYESSTIESTKKTRPIEERKMNGYLGDSLANSGISKQWPTESEEKENLTFTTKEQKVFTDHCSQLYRLRPSPSIVEEITREINKRDEVYHLVSSQFPQCPQQKYKQALDSYFQEHQLMARIIKQFKTISNLQMDDLNELYYFLKTDR